MSAWAQLFSLGSSFIKRPSAVWLLGIIGAGATAAATAKFTDLFKTVETFLSEKVAEKSCEYRQKPIANDSQFIILVSPLAHDPDRSHTDRVMRAFLGEKGFNVVPICESLNFDFSKGSQPARAETSQRGTDLIKARHADLLLFGEVSERDKAVNIYAVNEHGGCDFNPKPTKIELGTLPADFNAGEKEKLIAVSLEEIASACLNQSSMDWPLFAKRMNKMEMFLNDFDFSQDKSLDFGVQYIQATRLLYGNGQGEVWFSKGETFAKSLIDRGRGSSKAVSSIYAEYAMLLDTRFDKTSDKHDIDTALQAFDKAINLDPNNALAYNNRGYGYREKGEGNRAIEDYDKAISLDPQDAVAYRDRGSAYSEKRDWDHAIEDYTKAIGLDPKAAVVYNSRGNAYGKKGDLDRAIEDYATAISLDPKHAVVYNSRGNAYYKKGDLDRAIADYDKAISLDPKDANGYSNRGYAYRGKGDMDRAIEDFDKAISLDPKFAPAYAGKGDVYQAKGDLDRAIEDYTKAIGLDPEYTRAYRARGEAYKAKGDKDRATADFRSASNSNPDKLTAATPKPLLQTSPGSQTSRAPRSRHHQAGR